MHFLGRFNLSPAGIFLLCLILFIAGIVFGNFFVWDSFLIFCFLLALAAGMVFFWKNKKMRIIFLILIFFGAGFLRVVISHPDCGDSGLLCHYNEKKVKFIATVYDVKEEIDGQKIQASSNGIMSGNNIYQVKGNLILNQPLYPHYDYGDVLIINCPLSTPKKFEDFDYGKYLAAKKIYSTCGYGEVRIIDSGNGFWPKEIILKIKSRLSDGLKSSISEPQSSIIRAMILNETGSIPKQWNDLFSDLGLTHIIAISGSHITIIVSLIMYLAIALGFSRPKAFWAALFGIIIYVAMVGFPASAVRAAIMGILVIYAKKIGRPNSAFGLIILAASLMLALNPFLILYDVGFQLSFLAVIGLIYLGPIVENWFKKIPDFWQMREMLSVTISAMLMTLPLIIFQFGRFSPISILANILILPIIPFLTVFALLNAIISSLIPFLGNIMGWVTWIFTSYWLSVSYLVNKVNFLSFNFKISWLIVLICYALIGYLIFRFGREKIEL